MIIAKVLVTLKQLRRNKAADIAGICSVDSLDAVKQLAPSLASTLTDMFFNSFPLP